MHGYLGGLAGGTGMGWRAIASSALQVASVEAEVSCKSVNRKERNFAHARPQMAEAGVGEFAATESPELQVASVDAGSTASLRAFVLVRQNSMKT